MNVNVKDYRRAKSFYFVSNKSLIKNLDERKDPSEEETLGKYRDPNATTRNFRKDAKDASLPLETA